MSVKAEAFKKEFQELLARYEATIGEAEDYNAEEVFVGSTLYFTVDSVRLELKDLKPTAKQKRIKRRKGK